MRFAIVDIEAERKRGSTVAEARRTVEAYLPGNYSVIGEGENRLMIYGEDNAGWTLDEYVIPRLASGLIPCREVATDEEVKALTRSES